MSQMAMEERMCTTKAKGMGVVMMLWWAQEGGRRKRVYRVSCSAVNGWRWEASCSSRVEGSWQRGAVLSCSPVHGCNLSCYGINLVAQPVQIGGACLEHLLLKCCLHGPARG